MKFREEIKCTICLMLLAVMLISAFMLVFYGVAFIDHGFFYEPGYGVCKNIGWDALKYELTDGYIIGNYARELSFKDMVMIWEV